MADAYPFHLRTILAASKKRSQAASFTVSEPRRGYAYVQAVGTDVPLLWDVSFAFTRAEAPVFRLWFKLNTQSGLKEFTLPIRTEFGLVTYTCRFLSDKLMDTGEAGNVFTYSATIMARAEVIPDEYLVAADLIVGLPQWEEYRRILDLVMTQEMPV